MKITKIDIIMLIIIIAFSILSYSFIGNSLSNSSHILIVLIFGVVAGIVTRLFFNKDETKK